MTIVSKTHITQGPLRYSISDEGPKLIVEIDPELSRYLRSLIPLYLHPQRPRYTAHITVVRKEVPNLRVWKRHEGENVSVVYKDVIQHDDTYFWIQCFSLKLIDIRQELGLPDHTEYTRPPDGANCFHCTIANRKRTT